MIQIIIMIVLIIFNGIFAASEVALISVNANKIEIAAHGGNKKAKRILRFLAKPTVFLSTIQIGITLFGFFNGFLAGDTFADNIVKLFNDDFFIPKDVLRPISVVFITLILAYFQVVLGELVPKRLAMKSPEKVSYAFVTFLSVIAIVMKPFVALLTGSANLIGRLFGIDPNDSNNDLSEEEIRILVSTSGKKGYIDTEESEMIDNIFEFDDTIVEDIMTHRTEISAITVSSTKEEVIKFVSNENYTRFPIYEDSVDNIIGTLHVKELIKFLDTENEDGKPKKFNLKKMIKPPYFVPSSKKTSDLFKEMKLHKNHIAVVIDEYGGTAGIVTIEDLIEEILGDINDEYDEDSDVMNEMDNGIFEVPGLIDLEDVEDNINNNLPIEEFDTLSGFMIGQIGRFPVAGEKISFDYNNYSFEALEIEDKVITKVRISKIEKKAEELNIEDTNN